MGKLEELIEKLCPNGVKYEKLIDITSWDKKFNGINNSTIKPFKHISAEMLKKLKSENGAIKLLSTGNFEGYADEERCMDFINEGEIITLPSGGTANIKYYNGKFLDSGNLIAISKDINLYNSKYIYYNLLNVQSTIQSYYRGSGVKHPDMNNILKICIPVPPLEVQCEIVHILDDFTLLSAELSAELKARQKQYEYYRDELLAFKKENYECKTLGEIATDMYRGNGIKRTEVTQIGIPCVRYGEIYTSYNVTFDKCISHTDEQKISSKKYFEYGDVLFAITGESIEEIGKSIVYLGNDKCLAGGDMVVMKHNQNPKYMAYVLSTTQAQIQKSKGKVKSKVVHSSVPDLKEISIPVPPIEIQEKVADMLEKLDKLCNDILEGLPAEIEARQKQYEYYRDKLLTFKELVNEG